MYNNGTCMGVSGVCFLHVLGGLGWLSGDPPPPAHTVDFRLSFIGAGGREKCDVFAGSAPGT